MIIILWNMMLNFQIYIWREYKMITNLKETIELMTSEDYKERFEGEVLQLCIRISYRGE